MLLPIGDDANYDGRKPYDNDIYKKKSDVNRGPGGYLTKGSDRGMWKPLHTLHPVA